MAHNMKANTQFYKKKTKTRKKFFFMTFITNPPSSFKSLADNCEIYEIHQRRQRRTRSEGKTIGRRSEQGQRDASLASKRTSAAADRRETAEAGQR